MYLERFRHLYDFPRVRIPEPEWGPDTMRLQRNEKPDAWPKELLERIFANVPENLLQRYPDPLPFYSKLSDFLGVPKESLLVTSGVDEAIRNIVALSCEPGDEFAVTWPGYAMYDVYARMYGLTETKIIYAPDRFMTASELCSKVPDYAKVLFLPNPSQPVENCFDLEGLAEIAEYCQARDILFAVDEAYYLFGAPTAAPLIDRFNNVIIMRTFSKAFGAASIRLGYLIGGPDALAPLSAFRLAHEANALSLHAASVLLDCFESHVRPSIDSICEGRDYLRSSALEHGFPAWGEVSNNVMIDLGSNEKMSTVTKSLEDKGVYVKGRFPEPLDQHILVTCGPKELMTRFWHTLLESVDGR